MQPGSSISADTVSNSSTSADLNACKAPISSCASPRQSEHALSTSSSDSEVLDTGRSTATIAPGTICGSKDTRPSIAAGKPIPLGSKRKDVGIADQQWGTQQQQEKRLVLSGSYEGAGKNAKKSKIAHSAKTPKKW